MSVPLQILTIVAMFSGAFLLTNVILAWNKLPWSKRVLRLALPVLVIFATASRTWVFTPAVEPAPRWYPTINDLLFIIICIAMVWTTWKEPYGR